MITGNEQGILAYAKERGFYTLGKGILPKVLKDVFKVSMAEATSDGEVLMRLLGEAGASRLEAANTVENRCAVEATRLGEEEEAILGWPTCQDFIDKSDQREVGDFEDKAKARWDILCLARAWVIAISGTRADRDFGNLG